MDAAYPPPPSFFIFSAADVQVEILRRTSTVLSLSFTPPASLSPSLHCSVSTSECCTSSPFRVRGGDGSRVRLTVNVLMINQHSHARCNNPWTGFNEAAPAGSAMSEPSFDPT